MKLLLLFIVFISELFSFFENVKTFEANFSQIIRSDEEKIVYSGKLYIQKPDSIVWIYEKPIEKYIYIRDRSVFIVEPDLEQVIIKNISPYFQITSIFENSKKLSDERYITKVENTDYLILIKNDKLHRVIYHDEVDNYIELTFYNVIYNQKIDSNIFVPKIPLDYDRIY